MEGEKMIKGVLLFGLMAAAIVGAASAAPDVQAGISAWSAGDYRKAVEVWRPLATGGNADAQFNLAQAYKLGRGVPINLAAAQQWYERAARQGHRDAQTSLGLTLFGNGDQVGAMRWLRLGAEGGEPRAMLVYGTALFNGDGVPADRVRAYALVSRAAAQGLAAAKSTLSEMDQLIPLAERKQGIALAMSMAAPQGAAQASSLAATGKTGVKPPAKPSAKPALKTAVASLPTAPAPSSSGDWRIQLGAFGQRSAADALFRRYSGVLAGKQPYLVPVGAVTRLQVGPYPSRAAASAACATLRGQACFPVSAR
jgi:cell division septation protein DedD